MSSWYTFLPVNELKSLLLYFRFHKDLIVKAKMKKIKPLYTYYYTHTRYNSIQYYIPTHT